MMRSFENHTRRSHEIKFRIPYADNDVFKHSYVPKTIADWNCLSEEIVTLSSLDSFNSNLTASFKYIFPVGVMCYGATDLYHVMLFLHINVISHTEDKA